MLRFRVYTAACAAIFLTALAVTVTSAQDKRVYGAERTAQALERIRSEPLALRDFLERMPKGADLHSHLSGAVYAETRLGSFPRKASAVMCARRSRSREPTASAMAWM